MKFKSLAIAIAVLAILSAVAYYLQRPAAPAAADARIGAPVLDVKVMEKAAKLRISDQGKAVLLAKRADGKWVDTSYYDLPVDFSKLSRFVDDLAGAKIQRFVTSNPDRLTRLEFKDSAVAVLDPAGGNLWSLTLGKNAEGSGRFVRFGNEPKGYLANLSLYLDADAKNWADSLLVDLKPDDIAQAEVSFDAGEPVVATRAKKEDAWTGKAPAGQRIKGDRFVSLLSSFTSLRFQDTADLADPNVEAARQHHRTVKLTTFDRKTFTIQLGRKPEEKKPAPAAQKIEAGSPKPAEEGTKTGAQSSKPGAEGGKPGVAEEKPEVGGQKSRATSEAPVPANPELKAPNSESKSPQPEPKIETIPAGPVYAFITSSDPAAAINLLMKKRAFQIYDWNFTSLPQKSEELFEPVPAPPPAEKKPEEKPAAKSNEPAKP